jgi:YcxB-like protein
MTAEHELTKQDVSAFTFYHHFHSKTARRQYYYGWFFPAVIMLLVWAVICYFAASETTTPLRTWVALLPLLAAVLIYLAYFPWAYRRKVRKIIDGMIGEGRNLNLFGRHRVTISTEGLTDAGEYGQTTSTWRGIERVVKDQDYAFIYVNTMAAIVVPRRGFADSADFDHFVMTAVKYHEEAATSLPFKADLRH